MYTSMDGYSNWKKATFKDSGFCSHAKSESHVTAMFAWTENKKMIDKNTSMLGMMEEENKRKVLENQEYIKTLGETLLLTATQNIAQRGHRESPEAKNRGNFLEILDLVSKHDPFIKKRIEEQAKDAKYTSPKIQNEILACLAAMVKEEIIKEVKESGQFSVLVDETKDIRKQEQVSFVLRYYYNGAVYESFLEFQQAEKLDAASLTEKIIACLEKCGLEYKENLVGQGYDGASVMSGKHAGVQARVKEVAKQAFYVHCSAHCLNLVIVDSVKSVPDAASFFSLMERLYVFMSGSYVHNKWLEVQKEMFDGPPRELQHLSDTRWACRYVACRNVMDRLPAIIQVLEDISEEHHPDRAVDARGLLVQIDLNFIGCLAVFKTVLGDSRFLSEMLQSKKVDLTAAVTLIETLQATLVDYRTETYFDELWVEILNICETCNISTSHTPKRPRQTSTKLKGSVITSTLGQHTEPDSKTSFRSKVFYPVLDCMIGEMSRRFSSVNCEIMQGVQSLNPTSDSFLNDEKVILLANAYGSNIEDLKHELHQARRLLDRQGPADSPCSLLQLVNFLEPYKAVFFELFRLCKIAIVLPVSSASCERSFSCLKIIKDDRRNGIGQDKLTSCSILSIESKRAKVLDMDDFVRRFAAGHSNRRIQLL